MPQPTTCFNQGFDVMTDKSDAAKRVETFLDDFSHAMGGVVVEIHDETHTHALMVSDVRDLIEENHISRIANSGLQERCNLLRKALQECASHVGAFAGNECSDIFICEVADEVKLVVAAKDQEIERLRKALKNQITGWDEVLRLGVLEEREEWAAIETKQCAEQALKGGA
jgi:hypothetical protein